MNENSRNIATAFDQLRSFCQEASLLLRTADGLLNEAEWQNEGRNVTSATNMGVDEGHRWIPFDMFRFYKKQSQLHLLVFVAVNVADPYGDSELDQALVTAGWLDYGQGEQVGNNWAYRYARLHLMLPERKDDGQVRITSTPNHPKITHTIQRAATLGLPIDTIADADDLKSKIIAPLLESIGQMGQAEAM